MKGYFYPLWRRVSPCLSSLFLPFLLIFILVFSFLQPAEAKTVVVGTGSGNLFVTSMAGLSPGDVVSITPGTYAWTQFSNLNGVTIINGGGLVTFTGELDFYNNTNVTFTGSGAPGITYGYYIANISANVIVTTGSFQGCTWSNIEFVNCTGGNGVINPQNDMLHYDGVNNNTKEFYLCKFTNLHLSGCGSLMDNYQGPFTNVQDSCEYSYIVVDNATQPIQINATSFYRANIHHWKLNGVTSWPNQDIGSFVIGGSVNLHHNTRSGTQWGWFIRLFHMSLNSTGDSYIYNNIDVGGMSYGFVDYRLNTLTAGTPSTQGGNLYIYNNTVGNFQNINKYATSVLLDYGHPGFIADVRNNLRFNSTNYGGIPDSTDCINFGPAGTILNSSNNVYYADPVASGVLMETVNCYEKQGSPTIDKGVIIPWIKDDIGAVSRPQGSAYDIGAREYNQNTPPPPNKAPVAKTGPAQTITLPVNSATLDGSKSMDSDGFVAAYKWAQVSGPASTITNSTAATTTVTGLTQGTFIYQLTVTDNQGATGTAYDTIIVNPAANKPPVAIVGAQQTIQLPTNSAALDGSKSYDPDGTIASYAWSEVSGPAATITNNSVATTSATGLAQGTYIFKLTVTDNQGALSSAFDTIVVKAVNQPPVAVVTGTKQTITLPTSTATLDGSKSFDPDGTVASYAWSEVSGPADAITNASAATTTTTGLTQGTYIFQLVVTDNQGATGTGFDTVIVNPAPNQPPVAIAGAKQTITLPNNSTTLDGSKSYDPDGTIASYAWSQVSGPSGTITNAAVVATTATGLTQGTYIFKLTVTDNQGATSSTQDTVIVNPAPNQPPVAIAGAKQSITLPANSATLDGTQSYDPDGTIASYAWSQVSGPGSAAIGSTSSASTMASGLVQGNYIFQLTVTDNQGAKSTTYDTITVHPAVSNIPVADAGFNQTITLPTNSVTLNGTGSYDSAGTITAYNWSQVSGPSAATITSASAATTTVSGLLQGTYVFQLKVTDNSGGSSTDQVTITVNPAPNQPPVANAGVNQTITLPTSSTGLDGTKSADPDGTIAAYSWTQVSGPSTATITNAGTATPTVSGLQSGSYVFQLTVTDNQGATGTAQVTVTVNPAANQPPVANAGANQTITLPTSSVSLDGTKSIDADGTIAAYSWSQVSGPSSATITNGNTATPTASGLQAGNYVFQLTVTDNQGATGTAQVTVTVNPAANQPPVANAGANQAITLPASSVNLDGTKSMDPDGTIAAYSWSQVSGPSSATITNANTATPTVSGLQAGSYVFKLTVTDNQGATGTAQVTVMVNPAVNQPPVANAGANQTITLPTSTTSLDGTKSSDPDGTITIYTWSELSGPGTATLTGGNTATPTISGLVAGSYLFQLTVTDNGGATATATVTVTVNAPSQPPVANAGPDQTVMQPASTVTLDGSQSYDPGGSIASYSWVKVSGPGSVSISNGNTAKPTVSGLQAGVYVFQLTVTDSQGATSSDQVTVTVTVPANLPPVANAGPDQAIDLPTSSVTLDGTKSYDPDGTIIAYTWIQTSGPSTAAVTNANTATPAVSGLQQGSYVFKLTVTDNQGASSSATVTITINSKVASTPTLPPVANAGQDTTIALPANSVILDGTGSNDPAGSITTYIWSEQSGPNAAQFNTTNSAVSTAGSLVVGEYVFKLTVTNSQGMTSTATVKVTVVDNLRSTEVMMLYPNPAVSIVNLRLISDTTGTVRVNIFDMGGRLIQQLQMDKSSTVMDNPINVAGLAGGVYVVQVIVGNNKKMVTKLLKQ